MGHRIGIITATYQRHRFLPTVLRQVRRQSYANWNFVLCSDGSDPEARRLFEKHCQGDARMQYLETPIPARNWGGAPRVLSLRTLAVSNPPDYVVFWDDDNEFSPDALETIVKAIDSHREADLLLVPLIVRNQQLPGPGFEIARASGGQVDTGNFVVKFSCALEHYPAAIPADGSRGEDFAFFQLMRERSDMRIVVAQCKPIGRYDGLRPLQKLRWRLNIPAFGIAETRWYAPVRQWLRRS